MGSTAASGRWSYAKRQPTPGKTCKDCQSLTRPAPHPGPRCFTCHKAAQKARKTRAQERHVETTYGLTPEQYDALYKAQGGRCYICRRATGASKRLAVDHDHSHCPGSKGCALCCRGLLCSRCNKEVLGHLRDDPDALQRAIDYLRDWPSRRAGVVPR